MIAISSEALRKHLSSLFSPQTLRPGGFFRNVLLVMSGTGLAQVLSILVAPVLSRLYGPDEFGLFGSFISVVAILMSVLPLQYSDALMLPDKDEEAARLLVAACVSALAISLAAGLVTLLLPSLLLTVLAVPELKSWLWLVPLAALISCLNQSLTAWCARRKAFGRTATAQVVRSFGAGSGQTAAGLAGFGAGGLIGGNMVGDILTGISLWRWVISADRTLLRGALNRAEVLATARAYRDFPLFSTPQSFLNAVAQGAPVLLLIHYYGAAYGGLYAFASRVLQVPMNFFLTSLRQVLNQRLNEVHNSGGMLEPIFGRATMMLFLAGVGPTLLGILVAPAAFAFVFGAEWRAAGECARWLLVWFLPGFCNVPAVLLARTLRQQRNLLLYDIVLTGTRLSILVLGGLHLTFVETIAVFSIVGAVFNVALIGFIWRLVRIRDRSGL